MVRALPPAAQVPQAGADWRLIDFGYDRLTEALVERLATGWWAGATPSRMEDRQDRDVVPVWRVERLR